MGNNKVLEQWATTRLWSSEQQQGSGEVGNNKVLEQWATTRFWSSEQQQGSGAVGNNKAHRADLDCCEQMENLF